MKNDREEYKFAGIPTFMRSPYVEVEQLDEYDVGVIGVPVDYGISYREGAKYGPRSIREHSHWDRVMEDQFYDFETGQTIGSQSLKLADVGDVHISPGDPEKTNDDISRAVHYNSIRNWTVRHGGDVFLKNPFFIYLFLFSGAFHPPLEFIPLLLCFN